MRLNRQQGVQHWREWSLRHGRGYVDTPRDFFISYTQADRQWAEWIAWHLEEAGYRTIIQAWDCHAGGNFAVVTSSSPLKLL